MKKCILKFPKKDSKLYVESYNKEHNMCDLLSDIGAAGARLAMCAHNLANITDVRSARFGKMQELAEENLLDTFAYLCNLFLVWRETHSSKEKWQKLEQRNANAIKHTR